MKRALFVAVLLVGMSTLVIADPAAPPPPSGSESYQGQTSIKGCFADVSGDTLEYCSEPTRQTRTKTIMCCDDGDGQAEPSNTCVNADNSNLIQCTADVASTNGDDNCGTWDNPQPSCRSNNFVTYTEQRQYNVCGPEDGSGDNYDPTPETTDASGWVCPATKALSLRHESGSLDPGFSLSAGGYTDIDSLSFESGKNMSFYVHATIPACVNRIPMLRLETELSNSSGTVSEKVGLFARHKTLNYGPNGDSTGVLREVNLPDQGSMLKRYDVDAELKSYRMWAWRQRFADVVNEMVDQKDLSIPGDRDVQTIAQEDPSGDSVGDLWMSSDFLKGAEAPEPTGTNQQITRSVNSSCFVDVRDVDGYDLGNTNDFEQLLQDNQEAVKDLLGRDGQNLCGIKSNEVLETVHSVEDSGVVHFILNDEDGMLSTTVFENVTASMAAGFDVRDYDVTGVNNSTEFLAHFDANTTAARQMIRDDLGPLNVTAQLQDVQVIGIDRARETGNTSVAVRINTTRWMTAAEYEQLSEDDAFTKLKDAGVVGEQGYASDDITPTDRFDGKRIEEVEDVDEEGSHEVELRLRTNRSLSSYAQITNQIEVTESEDTSWNWRALQDITMTELAACMYNWEDCFRNKHSMSEVSWQGTEAFDAGYGPWEGSFTYEWSVDAVQDAVSGLEPEDQVSFTKEFDGARSTDTFSPSPVNVYRSCSDGEAWISEPSEEVYTNGKQFLCPNNTARDIESTDTVYTCGFDPATNLPDYVERGDEGDVTIIAGDYYHCKVSSPGQWVLDTTPPDVTCDDCVQPEQTSTGSDISIDPTVEDNAAGVESVSICKDESCSQVMCSGTSSCTYSADEVESSEVWVRARDRQGNQQTVQIGSFDVRLPTGAFCTANDQCLSGSCVDNSCEPEQIPPEVVIQ